MVHLFITKNCRFWLVLTKTSPRMACISCIFVFFHLFPRVSRFKKQRKVCKYINLKTQLQRAGLELHISIFKVKKSPSESKLSFIENKSAKMTQLAQILRYLKYFWIMNAGCVPRYIFWISNVLDFKWFTYSLPKFAVFD